MPWKESSIMDQRTQFIADHLRHTLSVTELCQLYQISRKTGYKWINRYEQHGAGGLAERSSRPRSSLQQTPAQSVDLILEARRLHPTWGAKKLRKILSARHPEIC